MQKEKEISLLLRTGIAVACIALAFVCTFAVRLPLPATGGYFNLGDTVVMLAAIFFGPLTGLLTGFVGPAIADFIGFPQFVPATAAVKGIEGLVVGLIAYKYPNLSVKIIAVVWGVIILVTGYFVFEAIIYPYVAKTIPFFGVTDMRAAIVEVLPNFLQGLISAILAVSIWRLFQGFKSNVKPTTDACEYDADEIYDDDAREFEDVGSSEEDMDFSDNQTADSNDGYDPERDMYLLEEKDEPRN